MLDIHNGVKRLLKAFQQGTNPGFLTGSGHSGVCNFFRMVFFSFVNITESKTFYSETWAHCLQAIWSVPGQSWRFRENDPF